jgi:hypothetical protein
MHELEEQEWLQHGQRTWKRGSSASSSELSGSQVLGWLLAAVFASASGSPSVSAGLVGSTTMSAHACGGKNGADTPLERDGSGHWAVLRRSSSGESMLTERIHEEALCGALDGDFGAVAADTARSLCIEKRVAVMSGWLEYSQVSRRAPASGALVQARRRRRQRRGGCRRRGACRCD